MSNELERRRGNRSNAHEESKRVPSPGKYTNTELLEAGDAGPMPNVAGKRASTEGLPSGSRGSTLPSDVRSTFERSFAADLSDVRVHEGKHAPLVGAKAYAQGNDIHFAPGAYAPSSASGRSVLGHELTHVLQQRAGGVAPVQAKGVIAETSALETEADALGERAGRGEHVAPGEVSPATAPGLARLVGDTLQPGDPVYITIVPGNPRRGTVHHHDDRGGYGVVPVGMRLWRFYTYAQLDPAEDEPMAVDAPADAPMQDAHVAVNAAPQQAHVGGGQQHAHQNPAPMDASGPGMHAAAAQQQPAHQSRAPMDASADGPPAQAAGLQQQPADQEHVPLDVGADVLQAQAADVQQQPADQEHVPLDVGADVLAAPEFRLAATADDAHQINFATSENTDLEWPAPEPPRHSGRSTRGAWSEPERTQIAALRNAITALAQVYVPINPEAPWVALRNAPAQRGAPTHRAAQRVDPPLMADNRRQTFKTAYAFADHDYRYTIEIVEAARLGTVPDLLDDEFEITAITPPISKTAKGRAYTGAQGFYPNPNYQGAAVPAPTTRAGSQQQAEIRSFANEVAARAAHFVPQTASADEPYVFCVPDDFEDTKQTADPGQARRRLDEAGFSTRLAQGTGKHARSMVTRTPAQRRQEAGRVPQQTAGNIPAARFMGDEGTEGTQGHLASHEYCHLIGDGDGGLCDARNLVVGSNSVNTEQLAMEETLRPYRPKFRQLGCGVMIDVSAITGNTPRTAAQVNGAQAWPEQSKADYIRYRIEIVPMDQALAQMHRIPVHTQVMDGQRGTITEMEVELLKNKITTRMEVALAQVNTFITTNNVDMAEEWRAEPAQRYQDAPMSPPRTPLVDS